MGINFDASQFFGIGEKQNKKTTSIDGPSIVRHRMNRTFLVCIFIP
jgi:hypothetical protein